MSRLWDKGDPLDALVHRFTVGDDPVLDLQLAWFDVVGSAAHVRTQRAAGLLDDTDTAALLAGLAGVLDDVEAGRFTIPVAQEDVHTAVETLLAERLGEVAGKLHTGRSRNDQVLTDVRLWLKHELEAAFHEARAFADALCDQAERHDAPLAGYTHLQPAMPSSYRQWLAGYAAAIGDALPLITAAWTFADRSPLGSAAGYGSPLPLDRAFSAHLLGFGAVEEPATTSQLTRGAVEAAALSALGTVAGLLSRWAWDVVLYASSEFGAIRLPGALTTGSSIMPQKRNPDVAELLRGTGARVRAARDEIEALVHLPGGYHRDLQHTKAPLMRGVGVARDALRVAVRLAAGIEPTPKPLDPVLYATADALRRDAPFREAYRQVAAEVAAGRRDFPATEPPAVDVAAVRARIDAVVAPRPLPDLRALVLP